MTGTGHLVAIDFGSTNTVAVLRSPGGRRRVLLFDGSPLLPAQGVPRELIRAGTRWHQA